MKAIDIMNVLNKMGAPKSNLGYKYIIDAVLLMDKDNAYLNKITALYEFIGKKNGVKWTSVEKVIRYEVECIFNNGNSEVIDSIVGSAYRKSNNLSKLPNKEFLNSLYFYIYYNMEESKPKKEAQMWQKQKQQNN